MKEVASHMETPRRAPAPMKGAGPLPLQQTCHTMERTLAMRSAQRELPLHQVELIRPGNPASGSLSAVACVHFGARG